MRKIGLCAICESKLANFRCSMCGRVVCENDYNRAGDICKECTMGKTTK